MSILDPVLDRLRGAERRAMTSPYIAAQLSRSAVGGWATGEGGTGSAFRRNPVVYRCVRMIADASASIPLALEQDGLTLEAHGILDLLRRPNRRQSGADWRDMLVSHLMLFGNAYIEAVFDTRLPAQDGALPSELHLLRPDRVQIVSSKQGWPRYYDYQVGAHKARYDAEASPQQIFHIRLGNPEDDHYGLSPLHAAGLAIGIHGAANQWNKSLFDNAARPSGALVYRGTDGQRLTDAQFDRLKQELQDNFQGAQNAGRPLLLEGGLDWASISLSPQDMDFIDAKHSAARDIALAFGVPPMLLGIPGDNAYANYAEANRAFWRQSILPLHGRVVAALGQFLCPMANLEIVQNLDHVPALAEERRALWRRIEAASFLSVDEKRALVGYGPQVDDA